MSFFNRKPTVRLDDYCRDFYNNYILNPVIADIDSNSIYFDTVRKSVVEVAASFADVGPELFAAEMTALRFELFGLAWLHRLGDKQTAAQSTFTKTYLEGIGRSDIWQGMEPYNEAIANSSTLGKKPDSPSGRRRVVFLDSMRSGLFELWYKQGFDPKCVARAANRFGTEAAWKRGLTPRYLTLTLCDRLACDLNQDGCGRLVMTIMGLYNGTKQALNEVKIES